MTPQRHLSFFMIIILMISLGVWQIQRGLEKTSHAQRITQSRLHPKLIGTMPPHPLKNSRILIKGHFLNSTELIQQPHAGKTITQVLSPFKTEQGDYFWVLRGQTQSNAPSPSLEPITIQTDIMLPKITQNGLTEAIAPHHWNGIGFDLQVINATYQEPLNASVLLMMISETNEGLMSNKPEALPTPWRHYAYTIQFFIVAIIISIRYYLSHAASKRQSR
ncbi:MAG: SURF1 family cytochrome oxidase biogenesis protein [Candidatus Comchoanobacterales bacterium]